MIALNLPFYPFKIALSRSKFRILDPQRRKYVALTPEEWVRQHFVQYLIQEKGYPAGLLSLEGTVAQHQRKGRYDALFSDRNGNPLLLVECKAPSVPITQKTLFQIGRYNASIRVPYLALTNGLEHFYFQWKQADGKWVLLQELPAYESLI